LPLYALAVGGSAAVVRAIEELSAELSEALKLAGCVDRAGARRLDVQEG
jgi:isopentenyl diphosphate isomerase/L-lactate dehydrogenase-like FMN-dependent dehydrogenase